MCDLPEVDSRYFATPRKRHRHSRRFGSAETRRSWETAIIGIDQNNEIRQGLQTVGFLSTKYFKHARKHSIAWAIVPQCLLIRSDMLVRFSAGRFTQDLTSGLRELLRIRMRRIHEPKQQKHIRTHDDTKTYVDLKTSMLSNTRCPAQFPQDDNVRALAYKKL